MVPLWNHAARNLEKLAHLEDAPKDAPTESRGYAAVVTRRTRLPLAAGEKPLETGSPVLSPTPNVREPGFAVGQSRY